MSWWQPEPLLSLRMIEACGLAPDDPVVDVGAGQSTLVDHALAAGYRNLTVLDVSPTALARLRARLGSATERVHTVAADVTRWTPTVRYALWHDRAVFHFLTEPEARASYRHALATALRPGGHAIVATFGPDGPTRCSGLDVVRYSADTLGAELGDALELVEAVEETHLTPSGAEQAFVYGRFRHTG